MLRRYAEQILSLYNYIDGLMMTDKDGYIEYYATYRPDINHLKEKNLLGKNLLDIYPSLTRETSSIFRVLNTGKPIFNEEQTLVSYDGQKLRVVNTTMPIIENGQLVGAIDVSRYMDPSYERQNITLSLRKNRETKNLYTVDDIITNSRAMESLKERIPMVAATDSSVLVYGETGTGKELVAQSIHTSSSRKNKKFVSQNCAAIPSNLLESILFGTVKGSYTGAETKPGLFEIANGGTLFLDEINSMEIGVQSKILKAIEEKQITRIGGYEPIETDIKIVTAVNENPLKSVREGKLREDLFYRLSVVQLNVPPLREREADVLFLTEYFINQYNRQMKKNILGIDGEVEKAFLKYSWPGNVRELKNIIEGAFNVSSSRFIQKRDVAEYLFKSTVTERQEWYTEGRQLLYKRIPENGIRLDYEVGAYEERLIREAIDRTKNLVGAAKLLGISKQALNYKIKKFGINIPKSKKNG